MKKPSKSKKQTIKPSKEVIALNNDPAEYAFEVDGGVMTVNWGRDFHSNCSAWIDFEAVSGGNYRKVEGLPIPPSALQFIKPGLKLKVKVTVCAN